MMEVILREDIKTLGKAGDLVRVKPGYARNFLLPRGLAYEATEGNKKRIVAEGKARMTRLASERIEAEQAACGSTALAIAAHNGLGCAPIALFGSEEQKRRFLPRVSGSRSDGSKLAALALTEPEAGSDLQGVHTHAELIRDEWVINGTKMWCTNASLADFIITLGAEWFRAGWACLKPDHCPDGYSRNHYQPTGKENGVKGIAHSCSDL